jgi:hypothetical protein
MKRHWPTFKRNLELDRSFVYTHWQIGLATKSAADMTRQSPLSGKRLNFLEQARCLALYSHARMRSREKKRSLTLLDELNELSTQHYVSSYRIAAVYAALGDRDRAFKWLDHAYEARDAWLIWLAVDPVVDSLRQMSDSLSFFAGLVYQL